MGEKNLTSFMKNLSAKIKYNEVSQASWGGTKSFKPKLSSSSSLSSNTNPSLDFLLNSAAKLDKEQKSKNKMLEEYRQKQEQPITKYDEFGRPFLDEEGNPIKFRFHNIPSPEIDTTDIRFNFTNPINGNLEEIDLPYSELNNMTRAGLKQFILSRNEEQQGVIKERLKGTKNKGIIPGFAGFEEFENINGKEQEKKELENIINTLKQNRQELIDRAMLNDQYIMSNRTFGDLFGNEKPTIDPDIFRGALIDIDREIRNYEDELNDVLQDINGLRNELDNLNTIKESLDESVDELFAQIEDRKKNNKLKLDAYYTELQNINSGKFNAEKMFDETDEQYLERLERLADIPIDNNINFDLAKLDQKKTLRENLKELIRDDQIINQVVNELDPELIFEFNKIFEIFKTIFIKKYGYDNKNIKYQDIISEFVNYMRARNNQQLALRGDTGVYSDIDPSTAVSFEDYYDPNKSFLSNDPLLSSFSSSNPLLGEPEKEILVGVAGKKQKVRLNKDQPVIITPIDPETFKVSKIDPDTGAPYEGNIHQLFFKYKVGPHTAITLNGREKKVVGTDLLISPSGEVQSYRSVGKLSSKQPVEAILNHLAIDKKSLTDLFGLSETTPKSELIQNMILQMQNHPNNPISPSSNKSIMFNPYDDRLKTYVIGEGLSNNKKHEKVKFGDIILMLNKLFYHNILSISRPDGVKINGFKNRHVSDDFVMCVVNMLDKENYQKELNKLSSSEKILLDNLLKVANLHKKVITGTGKESIEKLKKELEILEGEIQAGNNNESLKKKLHDILHKLAYFKVISLTQANKHYKEYVKNFF